MDRRVVVYVVAVLETLVEVLPEGDTRGVAESAIYLAVNLDLLEWIALRNRLVAAGWLKVTPDHRILLTPEGRLKAHEIAAIRAAGGDS